MKNKINDNRLLGKGQKEKLFGVLMKNRSVFSKELGKCTSYLHKFEVTDKSPLKHKFHTTPISLIDKVNDAIKQMRDDEVIEKANSKFINPLYIVLKKDGVVRLTIDAPTLNKRCAESLQDRVFISTLRTD